MITEEERYEQIADELASRPGVKRSKLFGIREGHEAGWGDALGPLRPKPPVERLGSGSCDERRSVGAAGRLRHAEGAPGTVVGPDL